MVLDAIGVYLAQLAPRPSYDVDPKTLPMNQIPGDQLLNSFCLAIQKHEGWGPGTRSFRNKNPGNLVFAHQPGATPEPNGRFAVFATYELGFQSLKNQVLAGAKGTSHVYMPGMNLYEFFASYAPSADHNDPLSYAESVATYINVNPETFILKDFLA